MADYVAMFKNEGELQVCFCNENAKIMAIGDRMNAICEEAYMNGYNWDAFFRYYLEQNEPDILEEMDTDPEAGLYMAFYPLTPENEVRAKKFVEMIQSLVEEEEELYRIVREESDEIEWD